MRVPGRVARTGIQEYLAGELGLPGDANRVVRVMRPADEVFNEDSLKTYLNSNLTDNHPAEMVNAVTYKNVTVGEVVTAGTRDGDFVQTDILVKDQEAINKVNSGKVQLSAGYSAVYDDDVPTDADYEFIQRNIVINHVALVDRARAGAQARLFDHKPKVGNMPIVQLTNDTSVEVANDANATILRNYLSTLNGTITAKDTEIQTVTADRDAIQAKHDTLTEDHKKLKEETSDEAIAGRISEVSNVRDQATTFVANLTDSDKPFTTESVDSLEIKREALALIFPSRDWAAKSEPYVQAAWDQVAEEEEEEEDKPSRPRGQGGGAGGRGARDSKDAATKQSHDNLGKALSSHKKQSTKDTARAKHADHLSGGWKKTVDGGNT